MTSAINVSCGPCNFNDATKEARGWCTSCEKGLCEACENVHRKNKITRNHQVISMEDYLQIEHYSVSEVCEQHGENLESFCKTHDKVLCTVCLQSNHKSCSDVMSVSFASSNAKQSTALLELEEAIERILLNVKEFKNNRETAAKNIEKKEIVVKKMILETRSKINLHLNKLQEKLLQELRSTAHTSKSKYMKFHQTLQSTEDMLIKLREQTLYMKQFSSDIQVFLATRHVNQRIVSETESIKGEIGAAKDYELQLDINSLIKQLTNEVGNFGLIKVTECTAKLDFRDQKIVQAQTRINVQTSSKISDTKLQVIKTFQTCQRSGNCAISSCVILPNGHLLTTHTPWPRCLVEYSDTGEHIRDIKIPIFRQPFDIAVIDCNRIVVTYGEPEFLEIMNHNTSKVEMRIMLDDYCWGVSHEKGRLYVRSGYSTIQVLDLSGRKRKTLKVADNALNITISRDRIYYADDKKVYCCRLNGDMLWQFPFEGESIRGHCNIAVDNGDNVYVVCDGSNNLRLIQHDGKDSKLLLTESDGLVEPRILYYDKEKKTIRICNRHGLVWLYNVG